MRHDAGFNACAAAWEMDMPLNGSNEYCSHARVTTVQHPIRSLQCKPIGISRLWQLPEALC